MCNVLLTGKEVDPTQKPHLERSRRSQWGQNAKCFNIFYSSKPYAPSVTALQLHVKTLSEYTPTPARACLFIQIYRPKA